MLFATGAIAAGALHAQPAAAPVPVRMLSAAQARADIALMRRALETIHPGLYRRTPKTDLDRALAELERSVDAPLSDVDLYARLSPVLAMIRCSHTKADQPETIAAWRRDQASHLPFRFRIIEGRMLVVSSDPAQAAVPRGAEILEINGQPIAQLIATLGASVAIDGFTEPSRAAALADDSDLMGAGFDHFYPYVYGFPARFELKLRDDDASPARTLTLAPISFRAWTRLDADGRPYRSDFADSVSWRMLEHDVGILRIDTFVNYRKPADASALYARALGELRAAGARRLIIDLRGNGGGSNDAALALIDALSVAPYVYQRAARYRAVRYGDLPAHISSWGDREALFNPPLERFTPTADGQFDLRPQFAPDILQERKPAAQAFDGPVTVLIGPANASGATMTVARLHDMGRVRLVGEPAGGSADGPTAGTIFNVKLPESGISVRVPVVFNLMNVRSFDRDGGVQPDLLVRQTAADFRAGIDRPLAAALADRSP